MFFGRVGLGGCGCCLFVFVCFGWLLVYVGVSLNCCFDGGLSIYWSCSICNSLFECFWCGFLCVWVYLFYNSVGSFYFNFIVSWCGFALLFGWVDSVFELQLLCYVVLMSCDWLFVCDLVNSVAYMSIFICSNYFCYFMIRVWCWLLYGFCWFAFLWLVFVYLCIVVGFVCLIWLFTRVYFVCLWLEFVVFIAWCWLFGVWCLVCVFWLFEFGLNFV